MSKEEAGNIHKHHFNAFRIIEKEFVKVIEDNRKYLSGNKGVDLGAGGGSFAKLLSTNVKTLYCVDVSEEAISAMQKNLSDMKNIEVTKVSSNSLPFENNTMDFVFTANSFHDLPIGYESEIKRVLKDGGYYIDLDWKKENTISGPPLSIRLLEEEVISKFKRQGLALIKQQTIDTHYVLVFQKN